MVSFSINILGQKQNKTDGITYDGYRTHVMAQFVDGGLRLKHNRIEIGLKISLQQMITQTGDT